MVLMDIKQLAEKMWEDAKGIPKALALPIIESLLREAMEEAYNSGNKDLNSLSIGYKKHQEKVNEAYAEGLIRAVEVARKYHHDKVHKKDFCTCHLIAAAIEKLAMSERKIRGIIDELIEDKIKLQSQNIALLRVAKAAKTHLEEEHEENYQSELGDALAALPPEIKL